MDTPLIYRLAIALGIGVIVGLERGWQAPGEEKGRRQAGIRTFSVVGLRGGVLAAAHADFGSGSVGDSGGDSTGSAPWLLAAGTLVVGALVVAGYVITVRETRQYGMTTELALLATFGLGALAV